MLSQVISLTLVFFLVSGARAAPEDNWKTSDLESQRQTLRDPPVQAYAEPHGRGLKQSSISCAWGGTYCWSDLQDPDLRTTPATTAAGRKMKDFHQTRIKCALGYEFEDDCNAQPECVWDSTGGFCTTWSRWRNLYFSCPGSKVNNFYKCSVLSSSQCRTTSSCTYLSSLQECVNRGSNIRTQTQLENWREQVFSYKTADWGTCPSARLWQAVNLCGVVDSMAKCKGSCEWYQTQGCGCNPAVSWINRTFQSNGKPDTYLAAYYTGTRGCCRKTTEARC